MKVNKSEAHLLKTAIKDWEKKAIITPEQAQKMDATVEVDTVGVKAFTVYTFIVAIICIVLAFGALILDEKWLEKLRQTFAFSELSIGVFFLVLSTLLVIFVQKRKKKYVTEKLTNESFSTLISICTGIGVTYILRNFFAVTDHFNWLLLGLMIGIGINALILKSKLMWSTTMVAFLVWFAVQTYESSPGEKDFFLGMNYPLRFFLLGGLMYLVSIPLSKQKSFGELYFPTYFCGVLTFFASAWLLSIFGNYDYSTWVEIRQTKVILFKVLFTGLLVASVYYGIKKQDNLIRDIGLIFFILNIYTIYTEFFWNRTNKGVFFVIMGISFWLIGRKLEQFRKKQDEQQQIEEEVKIDA